MNIYVAVVLNEHEDIVDTWCCYADNIREAKRIFDENYILLDTWCCYADNIREAKRIFDEDYILLDTTRFKVLFRLIKEK